MTEQELNTLERIWKGETTWPRASEATLRVLADAGYIEMIAVPEASSAAEIAVQITDEGSAHLSSSGY